MKRSIYHIVNHDLRSLRHNIMQHHKRLVTIGRFSAAKELLNLLKNGNVRLSNWYSNDIILGYDSHVMAINELKMLRCTGKQSNSGKSYLFSIKGA